MGGTHDGDLAGMMGPVACELLGEPNAHLSSKHELRFGTNGSLSVDLRKDVWFDHEPQEGRGPLDFITRETGRKGKGRFDWIDDHFGKAAPEPRKANGANGAAGKPKLGKIVAEYDYTNETSSLLSQNVLHK